MKSTQGHDALHGLREAFKGAKKFLNTTIAQQSSKDIDYADLPRYLMLGTPRSGKTTLLANSGLRFILEKKFDKEDLDSIRPTRYCQWWVTSKSIFLDLNGHYGYWDKHHNTFPSLWQAFTQFFKRYENPKRLSGIVIVLDIPTLLRQSEHTLEETCEALSQQLHDVARLSKKTLPIYVTLSKADALTGFDAFFEDLLGDDRDQCWGLDFSEQPEHSETLFNEQYAQWMNRVTQRQIRRLHQEPDPKAKAAIKDFPLQLEAIQKRLCHLYLSLSEAIAAQKKLNLRGFFLTSARQDQGNTNYMLSPIASHLKTTELPAEVYAKRNRSYFVKMLLSDLLQEDLCKQAPQKSEKRFLRWIWGILLTGGIAASATVFAHDFKQSLTAINAAEKALTEYQVLLKASDNKLHLTDIAPSLNALSNSLSAVEKGRHAWFHWLLPPKVDQIDKALMTVYHTALTTQFLPRLDKVLTTQLQSNNPNPSYLYGTLKAYLMLQDTQHLNTAFFQAWMKNYWQQKQKRPKTQAELLGHLTTMLKLPLPATTENHLLIEEVRQQLNNLPPAALALIHLKVSEANTLTDPFHQLKQFSLFTLPASYKGLPKLYTFEGYQTIFTPHLSAACQAALKGDWILGERSVEDLDIDKLTNIVKADYTENYAELWQVLLSHIQWQKPKTLKSLYEAISNLHDAQAHFKAFLTEIDNNTAFNPSVSGLSVISPLFLGLHNLTKSPAKLDAWLHQLKINENYLAKMIASDTPGKVAWQIVTTRLKDNIQSDDPHAFVAQAKSLPSPFSQALTYLNQGTWQRIATGSQAFIQTAWKTAVLKPYRDTLDNRYPVFRTAKTDASIEDFQHFFAPEGTLFHFFQQYLAPFVDTTQAPWVWKKMTDIPLAFNEKSLLQLHRAMIIKDMFFPENHTQFRWQFAIAPKAISGNLKQVGITMNQKTLWFDHATHTPQFVTWPGNKEDNITLAYETTNGQFFRAELFGPWGWFRMLDQETFLTTQDPEQFELTFDFNQEKASFLVLVANKLNPLIPGVVNAFRCPERLINT